MQFVRRVLSEAVLVAVAGLAVGLGANALSPRGLRLDRDYFLTATAPATNSIAVPEATTNAAASLDTTNVLAATFDRLRQQGLQPITTDEAIQWYRDPRYRAGTVVFVDARADENYQLGHIPGAWQLDYYHPEKYLAAVLPVCQKAEKVIVYCTGGDCEDSELTAILLRNAGIPSGNLLVYAGGITDWTDRKLPVETGARNSGQISGTLP